MGNAFFDDAEIRLAEAVKADGFARGRLFLYGAGAIGGAVWERLRELGVTPVAFVDDNPAAINTVKDGLPVYGSDCLEREGPETTVVIAVGSHAPVALMERCRERFACAFLYLKDFFRGLGVADFMRAMNENREAVAALDVWADAKSRDIYRALVRYRITFDADDLPAYSPDQYFNDEVTPPDRLRSFVDGGAYDGDTLRVFLERTGGRFDNYYAFEPLPEAYGKLAATAGADPRIKKYAVAISDASGTVNFSNVMAAGAKIDADRTAVGESFQVRMDRLDSVLGDSPVTMIKMDVEGEELRALAGAMGILKAQKPALAICTYHLPEHLWQIPLWIAGLGLGYRIRTLHHGPYHTESVCYAT